MVGNLAVSLEKQKQSSSQWFKELRNQMVGSIEKIDSSNFKEKQWNRDQGGGGLMSILKGNIFEKVGVNISTVHGEFSEEFRKKMPGTEKDPSFWASGISVVAHMKNPKIPALHFNTRFIITSKEWFGGGMDATPSHADNQERKIIHDDLKKVCSQNKKNYKKDEN